MQELFEESDYNPKDSVLGSIIDVSESTDHSQNGGVDGYAAVGGESSRTNDF
jgi:hypothetical protein